MLELHFSKYNLKMRKEILLLFLVFLVNYVGAEIPLTLQERFPDEGELIGMKFLTSLTSPEDLVGRDYHIIEFSLGEGEWPLEGVWPLTATLLKRDDHTPAHIFPEGEHALFQSQTDLEGEEGTRISLVATVPKGTKEWGGIGFHGHVSRGGKSFVFEPHFGGNVRKMRSLNETTGENHTLPHKVFPAAKLSETSNSSHVDVLRVPKEELEKAAKEMEEDEKKATNSTTSTGDEEGGEDEGTSSEEVETGTLLQTFAKKGRKKGKKPKGSQDPAVPPEAQRIVDIAVFADKPLFKKWEDRYPKQANAKLKEFVLNLVNNMHLLYQQPSLGAKVAFRLVHLEVMTSDPKGLDQSGGEAQKYLKSFCKYAGDKNSMGQQWDHALLLTGIDIKDGKDKLVAGMAWFATMCLKYWSCSISEGISFATSYILTHEMGHSLGMEHDGEGVSKACSANNYIMSPTTGAGKTTWSTCSAKNMKDFFLKGTPEKDKKGTIPACLTKASPLAPKAVKFKGSLPGVLFPANTQCQLECGPKCEPLKKKEGSVCDMIYCQRPSGGGATSIIMAHPALEGTACGSGKHCRHGKCVKIK